MPHLSIVADFSLSSTILSVIFVKMIVLGKISFMFTGRISAGVKGVEIFLQLCIIGRGNSHKIY